MKKLLLIAALTLIAFLGSSQIPQKMNYQAVLRNADGSLRTNAEISLEFTIYDMGSGANAVFTESQLAVTNALGLIQAAIGEDVPLEIDWTGGPFMLEVSVDGTVLGSSEILAIPYALYAEEVANKDDADPDPSNEIQDLQIVDNILTITGNPDATPIPLAGSDSQWTLDGDSLTISDKFVGIGTSKPEGRLVVMGDGTEVQGEPLFEVKKSDGETVFAVFNDFLRITIDSVRIFVDDNPLKKGVKGGFAVGGYNSAKNTTNAFMQLTPENYFIGHQSGESIEETGIYNSTLGYMAGKSLTVGSENIFLGYQSGFSNTSGYQNSFLGYQAGFNNTTGFQNSFIGYRAGHANTEGQNNLFLGYEAGLFNTTGNYNLFMGYRAGAQNTTGALNMFIGQQAGRQNSTGNRNLFIGPSAGAANVDGNRNIFIGTLAGYQNTSGSSNLFFGEYAGYTNTEGFGNIFVGTSTGSANTTGQQNIFVGEQSGYSNITGYQNTVVGNLSAYNMTDGNLNTILGFEAGRQGNGSDNVYIGALAGRNNSGTGNVFIGRGAAGSETALTNTLVIDSRIGVAASDALISGSFGNPQYVKFTGRVGIWRNPTANRLEVEGSASKSTAGDWEANSDMRIKQDITDLEDAFDVMLKLRPVKFRYSDEYLSIHPDIEDRYYLNFLAQEYREVFPESVKSSGEILGSAQDEILQMDSYNAQIYSIKAVQELIKENQRQKEQIEELYRMIEALQKGSPL